MASQPDMAHPFTQVVHNKSYAAISPDRSTLSSRGKTVLITGGSEGIGLAIATAFAKSGAAHIILVARSSSKLNQAYEGLQKFHTPSKIHTFTTDITKADAVKTLFIDIRANIADPDILVLNAAHSNMPGPTLEISKKSLLSDFDVNVIANISLLTEYLEPPTLTKPKTVLNVSTVAANQILPHLGSYGATKLAFLHLCMHLHSELHQKDVRILNFHPGAILTSAARAAGWNEDTMPWDQADLPGSFAVWLASSEAAFLAGRLVYANWDVDELKARAGEIVERGLLTIGLRGDGVASE